MIDHVVRRENVELERREKLYRGNRPPLDLKGKSVIVVDDGLATGSTMRAAISSIKQLRPKEIIVAVPVCSPEACAEFDQDVDVWCVCVLAPEPFYAVGLWYSDFGQTTDEEVQLTLARADASHRAAAHYI
jgi:putative phosphoribosyl transferase